MPINVIKLSVGTVNLFTEKTVISEKILPKQV